MPSPAVRRLLCGARRGQRRPLRAGGDRAERRSRAGGARPPRRGAARRTTRRSPSRRRNPSWGSRTAPVTIVEFADFQCPFCARAEPTLARSARPTGPDSVRIVWKNSPCSPFHAERSPARAEAAAGRARAGGREAFWSFHDAALRSTRATSGEDGYVALGAAGGRARRRGFRAGLRAHTWAAQRRRRPGRGKDARRARDADVLRQRRPVMGAQPFETFQTIVDAQLVDGQGEGRRRHAARARLRGARARTRTAPRSRRTTADEDGEPEDTKTVFKVPLGDEPRARGSATALVTHRRVRRLPVPVLRARRGHAARAARPKYGDKLRFVFKNEPLPVPPSAPSPPPRRRSRCAPRRATPRSGRCTTSCFAVAAGPLAATTASCGSRRARAREPDRGAGGDRRGTRTRRASTPTPTWRTTSRPTARRTSSSTAGAWSGAQPEEKFDAIIDEELKKAQAARATGTPSREAVYDALIEGRARARPQPETKSRRGAAGGRSGAGARHRPR